MPVITGYGEGLFKIGELLYRDDFEHLNNWRFQVQESDHDSDPDVPWNIFDDRIYTGAFSSYHKQHGYYVSIGGRENRATRIVSPAYTEGWFGFRLVRSHHIISNFRVYRLDPVE